MVQDQIDQWVALAKAGSIDWTELAERILQQAHPAQSPHQPDLDRSRRCGFGEVVFGQSKTPEAIQFIARKLLDAGQDEVLITRCDPISLISLADAFRFTRYDLLARTLRVSNQRIDVVRRDPELPAQRGSVAVVTAGSTDLPVAREALETLRWMGVDAALLTDVGVAGPYRLLPHLCWLRESTVIVVCAGMEGALASVMGGLVACPIIAVPTSIGYGANLSGVTTLMSMLTSCAAGVTVVNIDAGFKGGYVAGLIAARVVK